MDGGPAGRVSPADGEQGSAGDCGMDRDLAGQAQGEHCQHDAEPERSRIEGFERFESGFRSRRGGVEGNVGGQGHHRGPGGEDLGAAKFRPW